jgi:hypothetical protein
MKKRWTAVCVVATGGVAIWGVLDIRKSREANRRIEATRPVLPTIAEQHEAHTAWVDSIAAHAAPEHVRAASSPLPAEPHAADVDGSGTVDVDDILAVLAAYSLESCPPPCLADICCCGPANVDLDDIRAAMLAFSGEMEICPVCERSPPQPFSTGMERCVDGIWVPIPWHVDGTIHMQTDWRVRHVPAEGAEVPEGYPWRWTWTQQQQGSDN